MPLLVQGIIVVAMIPVILLLLLPLVSEALSLGRQLFGPAHRLPASGGEARLVFLVPAHNEAGMIAACAASLVAMEYPVALRRIVVIADNCSDQTADLARAAGAECFERTAPTEGGKPRALAWVIDQLDLSAWDACVVIDADTVVTSGFARALAALMPLRDRAVQAYFGPMNEMETGLTRLAGVLARVRYEVTYPLKARVGLNCPLTGNGMCLGAALLADGGWRHFSITENWELYADYTARGIPIDYAGDALLRSHEAPTMGQGATQRNRWMAGRLHVLGDYWRALAGSPHIGLPQKLDAFAELAGLSPILHVVMALTIASLSAWLLASPASILFIVAPAASLLPLTLAVIVVLVRHPEPWRTLAAFGVLPFYAVWRALTAIRTLFSLNDRTWRKTERAGGA